MKAIQIGVMSAFLLMPIAAGAATNFGSPVAAGGWSAMQPSDASSIGFTMLNSIYNTDTVNAHGVRASLFLGSTPGGAGNYVVRVMGKNNGLTLTCYVYATDVITGVVTAGSANTSVNGIYLLPITFSTSSGNYQAINVGCFLPRVNGGVYSFLWGADTLYGPL
jgi:hypothetical protein